MSNKKSNEPEKIPEGYGYRYISGEKVLVRLYGPGGWYHNPRREIEKANEHIKGPRNDKI